MGDPAGQMAITGMSYRLSCLASWVSMKLLSVPESMKVVKGWSGRIIWAWSRGQQGTSRLWVMVKGKSLSLHHCFLDNVREFAVVGTKEEIRIHLTLSHQIPELSRIVHYSPSTCWRVRRFYAASQAGVTDFFCSLVENRLTVLQTGIVPQSQLFPFLAVAGFSCELGNKEIHAGIFSRNSWGKHWMREGRQEPHHQCNILEVTNEVQSRGLMRRSRTSGWRRELGGKLLDLLSDGFQSSLVAVRELLKTSCDCRK